jgi:site-specific DNA recombinase
MDVVIYARVSSDAQDVNLSIGAQLRALREYAQRKGWRIVREFVDQAESGRTSERPAFREMIALAKAKSPPFRIILVWKLNRFARSRIDSVTYKALLRQRGIDVISINEPLEDSPSGRLLEGVIESVDEFYSASLAEDIKRGIREATKRGFFVGSRPPYGYHRVPIRDGEKTRNTLSPDANDSVSYQTVNRVFSEANYGSGCKEIAKALNGDGLRTSTGSRWTSTFVYKMLTNEAYYGTLVLGGRKGHKAYRSGVPPVRVENAWPAIVDKTIFLSIREKLSSRRPAEIHPRVVPSFYLLTGLLYAECGKAMIGRSAKSHRYYYYACNGRHKGECKSCNLKIYPKDKLERRVTEVITGRILTEEMLEKLVVMVNEELDALNGSSAERRQSIDADMRDVNLRLDRLYDALETGKLNLDELAPRIKELKVRHNDLEQNLAELRNSLTAEGMWHVDKEQVKAYANNLQKLLTEIEVVRSKTILRSFIDRITIGESSGCIRYRLPIPQAWSEQDSFSVLPIEPLGGAEVSIGSTHRDFDLVFSIII